MTLDIDDFFGFILLRNVTFGLKILRTRQYLQILLNGRKSLFKFKLEITLMSKWFFKNLPKLFDSKFWLSSWWLTKMSSHRLLFMLYNFVWVAFFSDFKLWRENCDMCFFLLSTFLSSSLIKHIYSQVWQNK